MTAFTHLTRRNQHDVLDRIEYLAIRTNDLSNSPSPRRYAEYLRLREAAARLRDYVIKGENRWNL